MNAPLKSAPSSSSSPVGKIVVLSIFGVAIAAASFALYWNMSRTRRALAFWGPDAVRRIQKSDKVEILPLENSTGEGIETFEGQLTSVRPIDVTKARGLIHARHALTTDASYEPGEPAQLQAAGWTHAVRFTDQQGTTVLLLSGQRIGYLQREQELQLIPKVAEGWRSFIDRETKK